MELIKNAIMTTIQNSSVFNQGAEHIGRRKCSICGKPYEDYTTDLGCVIATSQRPTCTCEEEKRRKDEELEQVRLQQEKTEKEKMQKAIELSKRFENSLMSKRFQKMSFDTLDKTKNKTEIEFCRQYVSNFDKEASKGIFFNGNPGTGKSSLLACMCNELIKKGYNCLFITTTDLLSDFILYSSEHAGSINEKLKWLIQFDFIVLDDLGRMNLTEKRREILFQIVDTLYNNESIIALTANPEMISKLKGDNELVAILDRLNAMCPNKFSFRGNSLRT